MSQAAHETPRDRRPGGGSRILIAIVAVVAIILSSFARDLALAQRRRAGNNAAASAAPSLSSMDSYALALLLGGLRGPLVMFLWPTSENQKAERNLEDFDTKIEWIRLLQAEFDTVHIFQIWNKAYNVSVQMANVGNKYATILDALDYAYKVDAERPNNVNMLAAIGQIFFDKLGGSQEKDYYKRRIRLESRPHASRQNLKREDAGWRRIELDPVLDEAGKVLPQFLQPGALRLTDPKSGDTYDGSMLQFAPKFGPYPYGLSPLGFAYNYYKRAQLLQEVGKQRHAQLSDLVIDSRPALALKNWAEDEAQHARRLEILASGGQLPAEPELIDAPTAAMPLSQSFSSDMLPLVREAIFSYDLVTRLAPAGEVEYERHVVNFQTNLLLYEQHRADLAATSKMAAGDRDYLSAVLAGGASADSAKLLESSRASYNAAIDAYATMILRFYTPPELIEQYYPQGMTRNDTDKLTPQQRREAVVNLAAFMKTPAAAQFDIDIAEYLRAILRAEARTAQLGAK